MSRFTQPHDAFGPTAHDRFDFTLLFQDTLLAIVPSVLLIVLVPLRIWILFKQRVKVSRSPIHESKMVRFSLKRVAHCIA